MAAERFRPQAGDPNAVGIEPLAERFSGCAARAGTATAPPGEPQSPSPWRLRAIRAAIVTGTLGLPSSSRPRLSSAKRRQEPASGVAAL